MSDPRLILLFSGKRKSGKDYLCEKLLSVIGDENCHILRISGPLKRLYAQNHNLDLEQLLGDGPYKEQYRMKMINWSDEIRSKDPGYFCQATCSEAPLKPAWIVSDIRRKTDIYWFKKTYQDRIKTVRISASEETRTKRGYVFTSGVDDVTSECNLDDFIDWDVKINNNSDLQLSVGIREILSIIEDYTM